MADILILDTNKPRKDPFTISEEGFKGLEKQYPGRFKPVGGQVKVLPDDVVVIPRLPQTEVKGSKPKGR